MNISKPNMAMSSHNDPTHRNKFRHPLLKPNAGDRDNDVLETSFICCPEHEDVAMIQEETAFGISLYEVDEAACRRSRQLDATVQASIEQALAMGPELMWHDTYVSPDDGDARPVDGVVKSDFTRSHRSESGMIDLLAPARSSSTDRSRRVRQSSNSSRPNLHRRVTNETCSGATQIPRANDLWTEFLRGKPTMQTPTSSSSRTQQQQRMFPRHEEQQHNHFRHWLNNNGDTNMHVPRHVDVTDKKQMEDVSDDAVSCLDNDDDASFSSLSSGILNDFLYGDSRHCTSANADDDNNCNDDNSAIPSVVMDDWDRQISISKTL